MNCIELIDNIARRLLSIIQRQEGVFSIHTPNYGWENHRYISPKFRLAHVEVFNQNKFSVVHCCVFPHITDPAPIYGFDVIAGENKITGVFMDLSPSVATATEPFTNISLGQTRERPEWGSIFSPHWIACRPTPDEMALIGDEAVKVLTRYLPTLGNLGDQPQIIAGQNRYCLQQRQNEHTRKALINLIGEEKADEFLCKILFPTIGI